MPQQYLDNVLKPGQAVNPLFAFLGVVPRSIGRDKAVLELPFRPEFVQGGGVMAGGLLAALADEAMAHVVLANLEPGRKTATVEMSVRYFRPVLEGRLTATATLVHAGRRILSAEALVEDAKGRLAAKVSGSFFVIEPKGA